MNINTPAVVDIKSSAGLTDDYSTMTSLLSTVDIIQNVLFPLRINDSTYVSSDDRFRKLVA